MAIQTLSTIKNWFRTGLKPTQNQFWDTWDSFRHKSEKVPVVDIEGIDALLQSKTGIEAFENHLTNPDAHIDLFNSKVEKSQFETHIIDPIAHEDLFNLKVEKSQFDAHIIDPNAHEDLFNSKENKSQKGAQNGYAPLNDFTKLASEYLDIVNDVISGGTTSVLSAEQGKLIQNRIDAINTILTSDNVNLDTVQELVDAIESVQLSLNSILVNDLTTGGTTKALTAEMGNLLQANKVDKVAGERLINAAEITKLSALTNVTTTVKTILSTALATQNIAGFITYINALSPVLVVGPNEIIKYTTSDTGRTFELNLRGRSFGVGQPAIVAGNVIEITEFLNKDIKLSNYPNTRNDGQIPSNRVLSTDVNGNLKLYTIATAPGPYIDTVVPDSTLPNTTGNFELYGSFFTPTMTVLFTGQTINHITFHSSNWITVNVTTGATEGLFNITLDNGISKTFINAYLVVLGTVFKPITSEWTLTEPVNVVNDNVYTETYNSIGYAEWNKEFDFTKDFSIQFKRNLSPMGAYQNRQGVALFILQKVSNSSNLFWSGFAGGASFNSIADGGLGNYTTDNGSTYEYRWVSGIMYAYVNNILFKTFTQKFTENLKLKIRVDIYDITNIKYIELAI